MFTKIALCVGQSHRACESRRHGDALGDQGADPNTVVAITDDLAATTVTTAVAAQSFTNVAGPTYGVVYRGLAYVPGGSDHDHDGR